jgi:myosin-3
MAVNLSIDLVCMPQMNVERYHQLSVGFRLLGVQTDEVDTVYRILAAILHLGDLEFGEVVTQDNTDNKSRVIDLAPLHRGV